MLKIKFNDQKHHREWQYDRVCYFEICDYSTDGNRNALATISYVNDDGSRTHICDEIPDCEITITKEVDV